MTTVWPAETEELVRATYWIPWLVERTAPELAKKFSAFCAWTTYGYQVTASPAPVPATTKPTIRKVSIVRYPFRRLRPSGGGSSAGSGAELSGSIAGGTVSTAIANGSPSGSGARLSVFDVWESPSVSSMVLFSSFVIG